MKIYDISQEVFSSCVYPGDPIPQREILKSMNEGEMYNLTSFSMCAHNGTHIDAPYHFIEEGKTIDKLCLDIFVGFAFVVEHCGIVTKKDAYNMIEKAKKINIESSKRILIKGDVEVSLDAAKVFATSGILLLGNEPQTIGPKDEPIAVHIELLSSNVVLLEGIRLNNIEEGVYFLNASPLIFLDSDGAPCRAILIDFNN